MNDVISDVMYTIVKLKQGKLEDVDIFKLMIKLFDFID